MKQVRVFLHQGGLCLGQWTTQSSFALFWSLIVLKGDISQDFSCSFKLNGYSGVVVVSCFGHGTHIFPWSFFHAYLSKSCIRKTFRNTFFCCYCCVFDYTHSVTHSKRVMTHQFTARPHQHCSSVYNVHTDHVWQLSCKNDSFSTCCACDITTMSSLT